MRTIALLAATTLSLAGPAAAVPIEYVFTGRLSGTLAGDAFSLARVQFRLLSDTDLVFQPNPSRPLIYNTPATTLNFTIAGTSGSFVSQFNAFSNTFGNRGVVGFTEADSSDIIDVSDPSLAGYGLRSAAGPVSNRPLDFLNFGTAFATSAGELVFADDDRAFTSFRARLVNLAAVPEPTTWAMTILGFATIGCSMRRYRRGDSGRLARA